ncbi:MAG: hypothetical protein GY847_01600 [Proteobacteria bacterium]|nr:hypothetical protein [Pseudomonadota bacterium]
MIKKLGFRLAHAALILGAVFVVFACHCNEAEAQVADVYVETGSPMALGWTPATGNPDGYRVFKSTNGAENVLLSEVATNVASDTLSINGEIAEYQVQGFASVTYVYDNGDGNGPQTGTSITVGPISDKSPKIMATPILGKPGAPGIQ